MIIMMTGGYSTIHVGDTVYFKVSEITWQCYLKYFRWCWDTGQGIPLVFQGGWSMEVNDEDQRVCSGR